MTWHIDRYDKLTQFGICIHVCIDGYSRNLIWLEAFHTNKNPKVILGYYLNAVAKLGGCPRRVRADMGTENGDVAQIQMFLRRNVDDIFSGLKSFLYGASTSNQRIEAWWGYLRKHCMQYWMDIFHTLTENGDFCGDILDKNLVRFCFMRLVQVTTLFALLSALAKNRGGGGLSPAVDVSFCSCARC